MIIMNAVGVEVDTADITNIYVHYDLDGGKAKVKIITTDAVITFAEYDFEDLPCRPAVAMRDKLLDKVRRNKHGRN